MGLVNAQKSIPTSFYRQADVVSLAQQVLGCTIHTLLDNTHCVAEITETEAYRGWGDKACHAHLNKRTQRTEIMYAKGGVAYVYLCYGIHNLFNIVTNELNAADAILIRAAKPLMGIEKMSVRRQVKANNKKLLLGPGNFTKGMGITTAHYGNSLQEPPIWLEYPTKPLLNTPIIATTRVGIAYAEEDANLPWRFYFKDNPYISKK